jgi:hypothetical protein
MQSARAILYVGVVFLALIGLSALATNGACEGDQITLTFASDGTWEASSMNPDGSLGTSLGLAQCVCAYAPSCPAGATIFGHPVGWGAPIPELPGACWIWQPGVTGATTPADLQGAYFSKEFHLPGSPVEGTILISADDFAEVQINGSVVGCIGSVTDYGLAVTAQGSPQRFDLTPFIVGGLNRIVVRAQDGPSSFAPGCDPCNYAGNPAGVVFGGTLTYTAAVPTRGETWGRIKAAQR